MTSERIPGLTIGDLHMSIPIVQGGMGVGISLSGLAAAVANEGGIGIISATGIGMLEPDFNTNFREANKRALRREIRKARQLSSGVIGVNILVALSDYFDLLEVAVEEGVDALFLGAGLPLKMPETIFASGTGKKTVKIIPIVSSARAMRLIFRTWEKQYHHVPDGVVVEGPLAGGHLGFRKENIDDSGFSLENILPEVISEIKVYEERYHRTIPVIAAGGVYSGGDIYRLMHSGAGGVQMATRFVATDECDASPEFKAAYVACEKEDLVIIDSPVGLPGRAIKNSFLEKISAGLNKPVKCPWKCLKTCDISTSPYCISAALTNAKKGILEKGFAFAGANAFRIHAVTTVRELIRSLVQEYAAASLTGVPAVA